ncbi:MAG TPA: hypothetical protein VMA73_10870, partial [Streptosporangiaceae bacterium]|nr:hypothetical protein [Streptosporangiaceae bacterium]
PHDGANLECGILIRGRPQAQAIGDRIAGLYASGKLQLLCRPPVGVDGTSGPECRWAALAWGRGPFR